MKVISIINFKGGVGKTTMTWLLARYVEQNNRKVLVIDVDAQMSLTTEAMLDSENGYFYDKFGKWYSLHKNKNLTIIDALEEYYKFVKEGGYFDFPVKSSDREPTFIYKVSRYLHLIPSIEDLYWYQLKLLDKEEDQDILDSFLSHLIDFKIRNKGYEYIFIDCPPNLTPLTLSSIKSSDTLLIPVNPDVFASRGVSLMLEVLDYILNKAEKRNLKIGVFMNKAGYRDGQKFKSTERYWRQVLNVIRDATQKWNIYAIEAFIPNKASIRDSVFIGNFKKFKEAKEFFGRLWDEMVNKGLV